MWNWSTSEDIAVLDALKQNEEYNKKSSTKTQYLWAIFVGENSLERKIKEAYVAHPFVQHYFMKPTR
jgi:hypothetical protein